MYFVYLDLDYLDLVKLIAFSSTADARWSYLLLALISKSNSILLMLFCGVYRTSNFSEFFPHFRLQEDPISLSFFNPDVLFHTRRYLEYLSIFLDLIVQILVDEIIISTYKWLQILICVSILSYFKYVSHYNFLSLFLC